MQSACLRNKHKLFRYKYQFRKQGPGIVKIIQRYMMKTLEKEVKLVIYMKGEGQGNFQHALLQNNPCSPKQRKVPASPPKIPYSSVTTLSLQPQSIPTQLLENTCHAHFCCRPLIQEFDFTFSITTFCVTTLCVRHLVRFALKSYYILRRLLHIASLLLFAA